MNLLRGVKDKTIRFDLHHFGRASTGPITIPETEARPDSLHHLHFPVAGEFTWFYAGREIILTPGHAYFAPAHCPIGGVCREFYDHFYLVFRIEFSAGVESLHAWDGPVELGALDLNHYLPQWSGALTAAARWSLHGLLYSLFARVLGDRGELIERQEALLRRFGPALSYAAANLSAQLKVGELAEAQGMTPPAFSRAFCRETGLSPKQYLDRELNQRVSALVIGTELSARAIGEQLGFANESQFSRFFKRMNGLPPNRYRRRHRPAMTRG